MREKLRSDTPYVPGKLRAALNWPKPPSDIRQEPFDYIRGHCERIATPDEPTNLFDFCDYFLDYQYMDVQRDLLHFALPEALEAWARQELKQPDPERFKGSWHFEGMWDALAFRPFHPAFLDAAQHQAMTDFMVNVLFALMQRENALSFRGSDASAYEWVRLHATLIYLFPVAEQIWERWWLLDSPQMAICAVQWLSSFLYHSSENPYFAPWTGSAGGGPPIVFEASISTRQFVVVENTDYFQRKLTSAWAAEALARAAEVLQDHEQNARVQQTLADFSWRQVLFEERVEKYITMLKTKQITSALDWPEA